MKYFLLLLTFIAGGLPIYKNIKETYKKSEAAKIPKHKTRHKWNMYEWIILLVVLFVSTSVTAVIQYDDDQKTKRDSISLDGHFKKVITGLQADTSELHKTNARLEQTKNLLKSSLDNHSLNLAKGIDSSGKNLIRKIISTTHNLNDQITGGDAYPIADIVNMGDGSYVLQLQNNFNNPIPNLIVKVMDNSLIEACPFVIEKDLKIYKKQCIDNNSMQMPIDQYEPNVPHLKYGTERFFNNQNKLGALLIEYVSPGYKGYRCFQQILFKLNGTIGGPYRYRIIKKEKNRITELKHFDSKNSDLNALNWDDIFKSNFDLAYKNF